jgi:hypothetical protein
MTNTRLDTVLIRQRRILFADVAAASAFIGSVCAGLLALF